MGKWIDERAWNMSMYICYALCFIVLSVAGYNCIMQIVGDVTLFMRIVLLICVSLFVALGVFLVFSVVITPFSELLNRLALYLFEKKKMHKTITHTDEEEVKELDGIDTDDDDQQKSSVAAESIDNDNDEVPDSAREALKTEFMTDYVRYNHQEETLYEVFEVLFSEKKSGAFAAHAFKCAMDEKWLKCFPGYEAAKKLFPKEDSIKGSKSNYSNANNGKLSPAKEKEIRDVLLDKYNELNPPAKNEQN